MTVAEQQQLTFEPEEHVYHLDGVRIPSVTQILSYGQDLSRIPAWTSQRGTALHLATEYDDIGDLDEDSVDPLVRPHLDAYRKWKARETPRFVATEIRVWGEIYGLRYCGTIDRVLDTDSLSVEVWDIKSGAPRKDHGAQVQAYSMAYAQRHDRDVRSCAGLYLGKDGAYEVRRYDEQNYRDAFIEKLRAYYAAQGE